MPDIEQKREKRINTKQKKQYIYIYIRNQTKENNKMEKKGTPEKTTIELLKKYKNGGETGKTKMKKKEK